MWVSCCNITTANINTEYSWIKLELFLYYCINPSKMYSCVCAVFYKYFKKYKPGKGFTTSNLSHYSPILAHSYCFMTCRWCCFSWAVRSPNEAASSHLFTMWMPKPETYFERELLPITHLPTNPLYHLLLDFEYGKAYVICSCDLLWKITSSNVTVSGQGLGKDNLKQKYSLI